MTLSAPSQILARQLPYLENRHVLIAGDIEDTYATELKNYAASITVFTTNFMAYQAHQSIHDIHLQFAAEYDLSHSVDTLLLYWPKAKAEAAFLLAMLLPKLSNECEVIVIGENRSGVKSIESLFKPYGKITKFDSARRCSFYWGQCQHPINPFVLTEWLNQYQIDVLGEPLIISALPGVFSQKELDKATAMLLPQIQTLSGKVLDFGCGSGVIGASLKKRFPDINIHLVDISALALFSATQTLAANGLFGEVFATDGYSQINTCFDHIISNPPFHAGLKTHYNTTETLLSQAPNYLNPNGQLTIVANNFLKYPPFIEQAFGHCHRLIKDNHFTVYQAQK